VSHILNIDFVAVAAERLSRLEENKKFENIEISLMTKKGDVVNCLVNTLGVFDSHGKLTHARSSVVNITDKIKEDNRLRILSMAVDQSPLSVEVTNTKVELEYVNEQFLKSCGYKWDEIIGLNPKFLSSGLTPNQHLKKCGLN
jgi:PAS domain-containing protein